MGTTALLPLRRKLCYEFLSPLKIHRPWSGSNPRTSGPVASTLTTSPPRATERYSSTLYLTLALDESGWSTPRPGRFTAGKETRYPLYRRLGGPQGQSGWVRKISPPPGFDPRTVQPVESRYTELSRPINCKHSYSN
jgi:hypothetical protein